MKRQDKNKGSDRHKDKGSEKNQETGSDQYNAQGFASIEEKMNTLLSMQGLMDHSNPPDHPNTVAIAMSAASTEQGQGLGGKEIIGILFIIGMIRIVSEH